MEQVPTKQLFCCGHLLTANNTCSITRIELICCGIWKSFIHVGSYLSVAYIIRDTDSEVAKCLIQLTYQVQWDSIVQEDSYEEEHIQRQVYKVTDELQVKCIHCLFLPLTFH